MPEFIEGDDACRDGVVVDIVDLLSRQLAERVVVGAGLNMGSGRTLV